MLENIVDSPNTLVDFFELENLNNPVLCALNLRGWILMLLGNLLDAITPDFYCPYHEYGIHEESALLETKAPANPLEQQVFVVFLSRSG